MKIKELIGEHTLDAVDFSNEDVKLWGEQFQACQVMRFRLDGICYVATEDPSDGYRSSMHDFVVSDGAEMKNVFVPHKVIGRYRTKGIYGNEDDVLELIDVKTGKTIIEVGTENIADYYPGFVASFDPKAMWINNA